MDVLERLQVVVFYVGVYVVIWRFMYKRMGDDETMDRIIFATFGSFLAMVISIVVFGVLCAVGRWIIFGG